MDVVLPYWFDRPASETLDVAANAERLGAGELWVGEMATFDAFALAGAIARTTERLTLVVGPLAAAVRDPVALAMGVASVAHLGNRPAHLAIGASSPVVVQGWHGRPWAAPAAGVEDTVRALRPLLAGARGPGGYRLRLDPPGSEVRVAAFGPRLTRIAASAADAVVLNLCTVEQVARARRAVDDAAAAAERPRPVLCLWVTAALDPGPAAHAQVARQLVAYLAPPGYGEAIAEAGFGDLVDLARSGTASPADLAARVPPALAEAVGAFGRAAEVAERVAAYRAAGADRVAIVPVTAEDPGGGRVLAAVAASEH